MNEVREKFAHLRRLREDLQNAVLRWIVIREATKQKLKSVAVHLKQLKAFESEVPILEQAASSLLYPFLPIGPFITVAGIRVAIIGKNKEIVLNLGLSEVQTSIEEDRKSCLELQQQLDSLENFISTLAEFLMPLNHNMVLLKEMGESGFEFLYKWIACEDVGPSTVTKVEFCAKFLRAATSAPTMSSSIRDTISAIVFVSEVAGAGAMARSEARCETIRTGTRAKYIADSSSDITPDVFSLGIVLWQVWEYSWRHRGSLSMLAEDIRRILNELECPNEEEIQGLVQSFIEGSFNKAYRLIESDKQRE